MHFEDVPINHPKQFLYYIELICKRACTGMDVRFHTWTLAFQYTLM